MAGNTYDQAMEKIRDEMAKHAEHPGIAAIGEFFTQQLQRNPALAGQLMQKDKTLHGAFRALEQAARARAKGKGGCIVISDAEGFGIAADYFGIGAMDMEIAPAAAGTDAAILPAEATSSDDLDLDALLGAL